MKLGPVTKIDKRNTKTCGNDVLSPNIDFIVIFRIYGQFEAIRKPNSRRMVCNSHIFMNINFSSYKNSKQSIKISNTALILLLWIKVIFLPKTLIFSERNAEISKVKQVLVWKSIFSEAIYVCTYVLNFKFLA